MQLNYCGIDVDYFPDAQANRSPTMACVARIPVTSKMKLSPRAAGLLVSATATVEQPVAIAMEEE